MVGYSFVLSKEWKSLFIALFPQSNPSLLRTRTAFLNFRLFPCLVNEISFDLSRRLVSNPHWNLLILVSPVIVSSLSARICTVLFSIPFCTRSLGDRHSIKHYSIKLFIFL